jgi:hypothetical protein
MMNLQYRNKGTQEPWLPWARVAEVDHVLLQNYQRLLPRADWRWISDEDLDRERTPFLQRDAAAPLVIVTIIVVLALIGIADILVR